MSSEIITCILLGTVAVIVSLVAAHGTAKDSIKFACDNYGQVVIYGTKYVCTEEKPKAVLK